MSSFLDDECTSVESEDFKDIMSDTLLNLGSSCGVNTEGLLTDADDSKSIYIDYCGPADSEYHVIGDKVVLRSIKCFQFRGEGYNALFNNQDLTKFAIPHYDCDDVFDPHTMSATDQDVQACYLDGIIYAEHKVDCELLKHWMEFQALKQIFEVAYDPFFEREDLIHFKSSGYRNHDYRFNTPSRIVNVNQTIQDLQFCRQHHNSEWF